MYRAILQVMCPLKISREELLSNSLFGAILRPYSEPDAVVYDTISIEETQVARGGIVVALSRGINPDTYTLTTKPGLSYTADQFEGLKTIVDRNGETVSLSDSGVTPSSGSSTASKRDHRGRIQEIVDPSGNRALKAVFEENLTSRQLEFKGIIDTFGNRVDERTKLRCSLPDWSNLFTSFMCSKTFLQIISLTLLKQWSQKATLWLYTLLTGYHYSHGD